jgi:hypothetical protein
VKAADEKTSSHETKRIIKETVDPKALKLGVSKIKNLANEAVFIECRTEMDRDILEKELIKISAFNGGSTQEEAPYPTPQVCTDRDRRRRNQTHYPNPPKRLRPPEEIHQEIVR